MLRVNFTGYDSYITDSLYQWDLNQVLEIVGLDIPVAPVIHFCNVKSSEALLVQSTLEDDVITCAVPNILLKEPYSIIAYLSSMEDQKSTTLFKVEIPVNRRIKPADYEYTDNVPILTYEAIEADIQSYFNKAKAYTDLAKAEVISETTKLNTDVTALKAKVPFGFGIDVNNNHGWVDADGNVVPFGSGSGAIDIKSAIIDGEGTNPSFITCPVSGIAKITINMMKTGIGTSYNYKVSKNGAVIKEEYLPEETGNYLRDIEVEVEQGDVISVWSASYNYLRIFTMLYVEESGSSGSGGEPVYNEVLSMISDLDESKISFGVVRTVNEIS